MRRSLITWVIVLLAGILAAGGSAAWLYISGYEADLNPGGPFSPIPWIALFASAAVVVLATVVLLRSAMRSSK